MMLGKALILAAGAENDPVSLKFWLYVGGFVWNELGKILGPL
jgi:hypothetical protein